MRGEGEGIWRGIQKKLGGRDKESMQMHRTIFFSFSKKIILDKIKYLTITDPSKVWMPDTFFRLIITIIIIIL